MKWPDEAKILLPEANVAKPSYHTFTMIRALTIVAISLWACKIGQGQSTDDEIRVRVTVKSVVPLTTFSGTITPVAFDPRFALTVQIKSAVPAVSNFVAGTVVTLAIHSPVLIFGGKPRAGRTYDFVLQRTIEDRKVRFLLLKVEKSSG